MRKKRTYRSIMLVDDNEFDNLINRQTIEAQEISQQVYTYTGAKSAIEFLRNIEPLSVAQEIMPELIILDVDMPFMDGFQFLEEFRNLSPITQKMCKIMILSSSDNINDFAKSERCAGVSGFARKPLTEKSFNDINTSAHN